MRNIAYFAPLKSPNHPVPSGDREMARNLMKALSAGRATVNLVSELQIYDGAGDAARQADLAAAAQAELDRLLPRLAANPPDLWVTYHNYYKSPDLIGPGISAALNIPYIQIETSRAKSRLTGPWSDFAAKAEAAADAADLIFYLTQHDRPTLERDRSPNQQLHYLRPFLPQSDLPDFSPRSRSKPHQLLAVGMMRDGDKMASYRIIAETLACLGPLDWQLKLAGDGPARQAVQALMAPFCDRVQFLGQLNRDALNRAYAAADLFVWPGANEAYGMVYLEAQAAGLPVAAQDRPGVRDILLPGTYPAPELGARALADLIFTLLSDPSARDLRARQSRDWVAQNHLLPAASECFWSAIDQNFGDRP